MTDLVPLSPDDVFTLAERVTKSNLLPVAYRGKPMDAMIAMLYGQEMGLPPMSALQRVVVINGKPTLDAQGMNALIRAAGHSIQPTVHTTENCTLVGKRMDNGDTATVEYTIADAQAAGLLRNDTWKKYPKSMLFARALSQLARELFSDVLMGVSYVPEEMGSVVEDREPVDTHPIVDTSTGEIMDEDQNITDAEIVAEPEPVPVPEAPPAALVDQSVTMATLANLIRSNTDGSPRPRGEGQSLRAHLIGMYGPPSKYTEEQIAEAIVIASNWPPPPPDPTPEPTAFDDSPF